MHARQLAASLAALCAACTTEPGDSTFVVERFEVTEAGAPYLLAGSLGRVAGPIDDARALDAVLPAIADALRVSPADLVATRVERDRLGMTHVRYEQRLHGMRVVGGELVVHVAADGVVRSVNGSVRDPGGLSATAALADAAAAQIARGATAGGAGDAVAQELVFQIANTDGELRLAWEVLVAAPAQLIYDLVYVDAQTGDVIERHPQVYTARNRRIYNGQGRQVPVFNPPQIGTEASPPTDSAGLAAHTGTGTTYDCYKMLYNRDSYDNAGHSLDSVVHVVFPTQSGGTSGNNAAWLNVPLLGLAQMVYGDGDGMMMGPTANGFDVTAHELTHAVTTSTANLTYMNESGALNEGMSDIMAAVCEAWKDQAVSAETWLVGEDIWTPAMPGDALRYMANPTLDKDLYPATLGGSRDFYADRYTGTQDQGGVHLNSGIANLAFYLLVQGGTHPRGKTTFMVPAIGLEKAGAIFYRALTQGYFMMGTTFAQARMLTEQVAMELYPGPTKTAVGMAWAAVGVGMPPAMDSVPPTVEIVSPVDGARVPPGFGIEVTANDDQGVLKVELSIDGAMVAQATAAPYTFTADAGLEPGTHTVEATAYDAFNQAKDSISVAIDVECTGDRCDPNNPGSGDGGGCCGTGRGSPAGALVLALGTLLALRRTRRN